MTSERDRGCRKKPLTVAAVGTEVSERGPKRRCGRDHAAAAPLSEASL
jgi:hypothetical protein